MNRLAPNLISAARFPLAVAFVLLDGRMARLAVVLLAAFTDWIDGPLARRTGTTSRTGEWLDPLADKAFMVAALIALTIDAGLPLWILPLLLLRDVGVALGALVLLVRGGGRTVPARRAGKWVTWMQFLALGVILLRPSLAPWVAPPVALLGAVALADYARAARRSGARVPVAR